MKKETKNIGFKVEFPSESCEDKNCPFHGNLGTRGRSFTGTIVSKDLHNSAKIKWDYTVLIPKYERYAKKASSLNVHNPSCLKANVGDLVKVVECRPISKSKKFVIIEVIKTEK